MRSVNQNALKLKTSMCVIGVIMFHFTFRRILFAAIQFAVRTNRNPIQSSVAALFELYAFPLSVSKSEDNFVFNSINGISGEFNSIQLSKE